MWKIEGGLTFNGSENGEKAFERMVVSQSLKVRGRETPQALEGVWGTRSIEFRL